MVLVYRDKVLFRQPHIGLQTIDLEVASLSKLGTLLMQGSNLTAKQSTFNQLLLDYDFNLHVRLTVL